MTTAFGQVREDIHLPKDSHLRSGGEATRKHRSELEKKWVIPFKHMGIVIALNFSSYTS